MNSIHRAISCVPVDGKQSSNLSRLLRLQELGGQSTVTAYHLINCPTSQEDFDRAEKLFFAYSGTLALAACAVAIADNARVMGLLGGLPECHKIDLTDHMFGIALHSDLIGIVKRVFMSKERPQTKRHHIGPAPRKAKARKYTETSKGDDVHQSISTEASPTVISSDSIELTAAGQAVSTTLRVPTDNSQRESGTRTDSTKPNLYLEDTMSLHDASEFSRSCADSHIGTGISADQAVESMASLSGALYSNTPQQPDSSYPALHFPSLPQVHAARQDDVNPCSIATFNDMAAEDTVGWFGRQLDLDDLGHLAQE